ncbi:MAG: flagellar biosynthesis regulator FlaF [Rhizobiaceae bacterium]|nr:flagellar biosynthesis regulator FlaF [Hyphomicrobiales bacterium]NRB30518.1 flagellar biosynthesis regulator FlaF [Rhizobiaceae bacterium]
MYQLQYADIQEDAVVDARTRERQLLNRSIDLMEKARDDSSNPMGIIEATHFTRRLWTALLEDLAQPDNQLSDEIRAGLISVGIWILKENEKIRQRESDDFDGVIEITQTIMEGI